MQSVVWKLAGIVDIFLFDEYLNVIADRIANVDLYYGNQLVGTAKDGLMSGWKTTSIFGSLVNISIFRCALRYAKAPKPSYLVVLGDDIDVSFDWGVDLDSLYDFYDLISFPVAKNKTRTTVGDIK